LVGALPTSCQQVEIFVSAGKDGKEIKKGWRTPAGKMLAEMIAVSGGKTMIWLGGAYGDGGVGKASVGFQVTGDDPRGEE
jgi:hypothetical protein